MWSEIVSHWHFCRLTCIQPKQHSSTTKIQCQFTQFQNSFWKLEVHFSFLENRTGHELSRRYFELDFPMNLSLGYLNVYSIWSHWDSTFCNDFFSMLSPIIYKCNICHNECTQASTTMTTIARAAKAFAWAMSMLSAHHHPIQNDFIFIASYFPFHTISACFAQTQIQLVKCEFHPHSATENM